MLDRRRPRSDRRRGRRPAGRRRLESWIHIEIDRETDQADVAALTSSLHGCSLTSGPRSRTGAGCAVAPLALSCELPAAAARAGGPGGRGGPVPVRGSPTTTSRSWATASTTCDATSDRGSSAPPRAAASASCATRQADQRRLRPAAEAARAKARERTVLILTKANSRSTVHRPTYLDYVGVKTFNDAVRVVGERRFLGLC